MSSIEIELNSDGVSELLRSAEIQQVLKTEAQAVANRYGKGAKVYVSEGKSRAHANIVTSEKKNGDSNDLLRAMR